jgi:hypothetical protein
MESIDNFVAHLPENVDVWSLSEEERQAHWKKTEEELNRIQEMSQKALEDEYYADFIKAIAHCSEERQEELKEEYKKAKDTLKKNYVVHPIPGHYATTGKFDVIFLTSRVN